MVQEQDAGSNVNGSAAAQASVAPPSNLVQLFRPDGRAVWVNPEDVEDELASGRALAERHDFDEASAQIVATLKAAADTFSRGVAEIRGKGYNAESAYAMMAAAKGDFDDAWRIFNLSISSRYAEEGQIRSLAAHQIVHGNLDALSHQVGAAHKQAVDVMVANMAPEERKAALEDAADETEKALSSGHSVWQERPGTQEEYRALTAKLRQLA